MMNNKEHLTPEGLNKIISIKVSLNKGLTPLLISLYPANMKDQKLKFQLI